MTAPNFKTTPETDCTVRARVEQQTKEQWEAWCDRVNITPSQALRWLITMHLSDPSKVWDWLAAQDKGVVDEKKGDA